MLAFDILSANDLSMHVLPTSLFHMRIPNKASHCGNMLTTRETENLSTKNQQVLRDWLKGGSMKLPKQGETRGAKKKGPPKKGIG